MPRADYEVAVVGAGSAGCVAASTLGTVVDRDGRIYGLRHARVADASVPPNLPRANTNLTCMLVGPPIAERMLR